MIYECINSKVYPDYIETDKFSGRCRLPSSVFNELGVRIGWIVHVLLIINIKQLNNNNEILEKDLIKQEVICTAWPDTNNRLQDNTICIDDTVLVPLEDNNNNKKKLIICNKSKSFTSWIDCKCEILKVYPPKLSTSVNITLYNSINTVNTLPSKSSAFISGLPVCTGCIIQGNNIYILAANYISNYFLFQNINFLLN
jgi:hypothetical protein